MAKIQLTIKTSYLPNWHVYEGIRELLQNGRDAEVEHGAPLKIDWYNDTLRIENEGTVLPIKALLLGHTTKLGNSDMIGKFGEGLKLGILALVRAGRSVKIRTGSEVWIPRLEKSEIFDEEVLTFQIQGGREFKNRVRVEIQGISKATWEEYSGNFLFLNPPPKSERIDSYTGTLLTGEEFRGKVYVKGIFVQHIHDLAYGYDLRDCDLDRDRKMVNTYDFQSKSKSILLNSVSNNAELFENFFEQLEQNLGELKNVESYQLYDLSLPQRDKVVDTFYAKYGKDSVPVANIEQSRQVEHYGKRGIVVGKALGSVLTDRLGSVEAQLSCLANEVFHRYGWVDLSNEERSTLESVVAEVASVTSVGLDTVDIVDFRSDSLEGQFSEGRILIARKMLATHEQALTVLIHEVAHHSGRDGEHSHIDAIQNLWAAVYRNLRNRCQG